MESILWRVVVLQCLIGALCGSVSRGQFSEVKLFLAPAAYDVETAVAVNDADASDKEVGYHIRGSLHVRSLYAGDENSEFFLQFNLIKPKLFLRGKGMSGDYRHYKSIWDSYPDTEFYVHWKRGVIQTAYLDASEPVDVLNYKKSLISLFQFQIIDGEYKEIDMSGTCDVLYESISTEVFRKIKRNCAVAGTESPLEAQTRRVARYTLGAAPYALRGVFADELVAAGPAGLAVKARGWTRLHLAAAPGPPGAPPPLPPLPDLRAAEAALPPALAPVPLVLAADDVEDDILPLERELAAAGDALRADAAGTGGRATDAAAALRLPRVLAATPAPRLRALLAAAAADADADVALSGLCRMLGLAGARATHAAADEFLHLSARDALQPLAGDYLAALAQAPNPDPRVVAAASRLAAEARSPAVADAALLAASAAAARLGRDDLARATRDDVVRSLSRCKDDACRAIRLRALGHLGREDGAEPLLEHAERGSRAAALAALDALASLPARALTAARRRRVERVALQPGRALELRAAALDLALRRGRALPLALVETALALHRHGPVELRRLFRQRLAELAETDEGVRDALRLLPPALRSPPALAPGGTSAALTRDAGWRWAGWTTRLDSLQVASAGLLRRGRVALAAHAPDGSAHDLLTVEVWTRGLEAVAGGGPADPALDEGEAEAGETAGGLALAVGGVALPPVNLFAGQAELLGHVWAGTGSAPTPVLRGVRTGAAGEAAVRLQGGAVARAGWRAAGALALDAHAAVSLWSRSARGGLELRAGLAAEADVRVVAAWGRAAARVRGTSEPRLRIAADLDFYDAVALCVRVRLDDYDVRRESWRESAAGAGARGLRVRHARNATLSLAGRTLSLGRAPDAACRLLRAGDDD